MKTNILHKVAAALIAVFALSAILQAQTATGEFPSIKIGNFGQMDAGYYRGAQPLASDYQSLKDLGVHTVIDLRDDPTDYEKADVEALGMKYVNLALSGWKTPKDQDIEQFLALLKNPETGTVYVHCKAGIHRTGITAAVYRMTKYGWNYDQAYAEMKKYNFTSGLVHGALKGYVKDYAKKLANNPAALPLQTAKTTTVAN